MACLGGSAGFGGSGALPSPASLRSLAVARARARPRGRSRPRSLRVAFRRRRPGFDPVRVSDLYSNTVNEAIFERLLTYDYLARPAKLVPMAAEAMPEVTDNGRTYMFRIRKGIYFTPDPAFKGEQARADGRGLRLHVQALRRPEEPLAVGVPARGQDRGPGRAASRRRRRSASSTTTPRSPACTAVDRYTLRIRLKRAGLHLPLHRRPRAVRRDRARGDRGLRRRHAWRIRSAPGPTC